MSAHAAEARRLLSEVRHEDQDEVAFYGSDSDQIAAAQVEATLALVEQVRISNLAALANVDPFVELGEGGATITSALVEQVDPEVWDTSKRLRPEIAAALGIEPSHV